MTAGQHAVVLAALPLGLILAGYWLAAFLSAEKAPTRIAVAALAGLASLLWSVSVVNLFRPLAGGGAWLCLWPCAVSLLFPASRRAFVADLLGVARTRRGLAAAGLLAAFFVLLLWPLFRHPALVFYDGTNSHDAFFWITAAEHLKRHTYLSPPASDALHPLMAAAQSIIGWHPLWGRMGGEGLLALTSSLLGAAPIKLYLTATAALLVPWIAAVFLATHTFLTRRLGTLATFALVALHPVFVFFHGNANLPNLLGALMATTVIVATERSLRPGGQRRVWLVLLALSFHGVLCSYPELLPFLLLPGGLLWLRALAVPARRPGARIAVATVLAWLGGLALNPASTARAWSGFISSFDLARANQNWPNLFAPLSPGQYAPAMAALSLFATKSLGPLVGLLLTAALAWAIVAALRQATDRLGTLLALAGSAALLAYTMATGFNYGWQKTVQFGGPLWVAWFSVALVGALAAASAVSGSVRLLHRAALAGLLAFFSYATVVNCLDEHKWSGRKVITRDWFALRDTVRTPFPPTPVFVESATFRTAFFHGMWAAYFLAETPLHFAARGNENGGYLHEAVALETDTPVPATAAVLVSREWADAFDANSPRRFTSDTVVLLRTANRVTRLSGLSPETGVPREAGDRLTVELTPHSPSEFQLTLAPSDPATSAPRRWMIRRTLVGAAPYTAELEGPPPWLLRVPLTGGESNIVELQSDASLAAAAPPYLVTDLRIVTTAPIPPSGPPAMASMPHRFSGTP